MLLTESWPKSYALLHGFWAATNPCEKSFEELLEVLRVHYEPKPVVIAEQYHFY